MSPVRTREIAAEALGEFLRGQSAHVVIESLFVFQPDLKVVRGGLYDDGWLKAGASHLSNRLNAEVVNQAQRMSAVWPDEDVRPTRILPSQGWDRLLDPGCVPGLAEQHATVLSQNADFKIIACHRCELSSDLPIVDDAAHLIEPRAPLEKRES
jgi:hypothetical protein